MVGGGVEEFGLGTGGAGAPFARVVVLESYHDCESTLCQMHTRARDAKCELQETREQEEEGHRVHNPRSDPTRRARSYCSCPLRFLFRRNTGM